MTTILHNPKSQEIYLKENEEQTFFIIFNNSSNEVHLDINFAKNSKINLYLAAILNNEEQITLNINSKQTKEKSISNFIIRSLLIDKSSFKFKGNIFIPKGAKKSSASLYHHTLLLSKDARVETIPSLEIIENDVKANHGASTGKLNEDEIFYIASRGLKRIEAINLLTQGFIKKDLKFILDKTSKEEIEKQIDQILSEKIAKTCKTNPCKCVTCKF